MDTYVAAGRALQESLMTDTISVVRDGVEILADVPCRTHHGRLFTASPDPNDANTRDMAEFGFTVPISYKGDIAIGDTIEGDGFSVIVGELLEHDTWAMAIRIWASRPKDASVSAEITIWRYDSGVDDFVEYDDFTVRIHYDRNQPEVVPPRYSPAGVTMYKGGTVVGDMDFDPKPGDRFNLTDLNGVVYPCVIQYVSPLQPQRIEAHFQMDVSGPRM